MSSNPSRKSLSNQWFPSPLRRLNTTSSCRSGLLSGCWSLTMLRSRPLVSDNCYCGSPRGWLLSSYWPVCPTVILFLVVARHVLKVCCWL